MQKNILFSCLFLLLLQNFVLGQNHFISGKVLKDSSIAAGISVTIKGSSLGTTTNFEGLYNLQVPESAKIIIFSGVGISTVEEVINNRTVINIFLKKNEERLNEVVITSLGIKTDRDKFASSATTVKGSNIAESGETGVLQGLSGKAAGVLITRNGGDPGAGAYIQIRGQNTVSGNAQPLFIIDGMPVSNTSDNLGAARGNGIVQQSRINDINPEDIERVEVLKGASAAALWGTRAANGVIIITTKKGKNTYGKLNITLNSTVSFDRINKMHPLQTNYGQGSNGLYSQGNRVSFGDLVSGRTGGADNFLTNPAPAGYQGFVTLADGSVRYAIAPGTAFNPHGGKNSTDTWDHRKDAFETGHYFDNDLTISGGSAKSAFFISYSDLNQQGVVKAFSDYNRQTARVNATTEFTNWIKASASVGYSKINSSRVQEGDNVDGILLSSLRTPGDFNNKLYTGTYTDPAGQIFSDTHVSYRNPLGKDLNTIYANPLWNINNNKNTSDVNRITGTAELTATPAKWLSTTGRFGIDNFTDTRLERFARNSANFAKGYLSKNWINEKQFNTDLFAIAKHKINSNFSGSLLGGFNYNSRRRESLSDAITNFIIPTAPNILTNALNSNLSASNYNSLIRTYAFYAQADLEAYNMFYLTLTGRNESASTFGNKTKNNFFFPSAALAWQFSELDFLQNSSILSFGKLRATWGQVGIQPQPYQNFTTYNSGRYADMFSSGFSAISQLYNGGFVRSVVQGNDFLKPEIKTESELGFDLRFLKNRISLSATGYYNRTKDVILPLNISSATGFTIRNTNAAELQNKGLELELSADVIRKGNFKWNISANFSMNHNKVISLANATAYTLPDSFIENASLIPGEPFGVFLSTDFLKDPKSGKYLLDANGFPQPGTGTEIIGDPNPNWRGGLGTTVGYKNLSLYLLFDRVSGNDIFNGTRGSLYAFGTHGDQGNTIVVPAGGLKDVNGNILVAGTTYQGQVKDFGAGPVALNQAWYQGRGTASNTASYRQFTEDGSASRLREATLSYSFNSLKFKRFSRLTSIDFSLTGRNLFLWTNYSGIDPEANVTGAGLARGQDWFTNPNTKSILLSVKIKY